MRKLAAMLGLVLGSWAFATVAHGQTTGTIADPSASLASQLAQALRIAGRHERLDATRRILAGVGYDFRPGTGGDAGLPGAEGSTAAPAEPQILPLAFVVSAPGIPHNKAFLAELGTAQINRARVIVLSRGSYTLAGLAKAMAGQGGESPVSIGADGASIKLPIYVGPGAELTISGRDAPVAVLDAAKGAFIASAGRLTIRDTKISGSVGLRRRPDNDQGFGPFLLIGDGGTLLARNAVFTRLGSRQHPFGIELRHAAPDSSIAGSQFADSYGLRIESTGKAAITENEFGNLLGPAIHVLHSSDATIRGNLIHWATGGPGILLGENTSGARVSGNVLVLNQSGIAAAMDGGGNIIEANAVIASNAAGIGLRGRSCNLVSGNALLANRGDGVAWRGGPADIVGNRIAFNRAAGVSSQRIGAEEAPQSGELFLKDNLFQKNRFGLRIDAAAGIALENNSFSRQSPRLIAGQLGALSGTIMRAGAERISFAAGGGMGFKQRKTDGSSREPVGCMARAADVEVN